ncbi:MAG: choloylglycine hydrolase [Lachnospiraceae bacterium]|nr:choloylglycine hydrolase [Lachnospiraceae bacterium]
MCTAVSYKSDYHYFGRNLDLEYRYQEEITITPRNFSLPFRTSKHLNSHYAIIGMAYVAHNYPLYYDATNEMGLSMAGLNFPGNAFYPEYRSDKDNITPFELIPWILGLCSSITEATTLLNRLNIVNLSFNPSLPLSPLHWMISDSTSSLVVESTKEGLKYYENPIKVLTNNPTFDLQLFNLNNYIGLSSKQPDDPSPFSHPLSLYSRGLGALGLPGDYSSQSRFVKAAFVRCCCMDYQNKTAERFSLQKEEDSLSQFFHILSSVSTPKGCVEVDSEKYQYTIYSSCCNTDLGIYYYTTYDNPQIQGVNLHHVDLNADTLFRYPLLLQGNIHWQN